MMNLVSFETPPLGRQERVLQQATTTTRTTPIMSKDASSRSTFFDGHLDLSLGMSMSPSGGATAGCSGAKASDSHHGHKGDISRDEAACKRSGGITTLAADLLSPRHGYADLKAGAAGWTSALMGSPIGFMHPWSLAARQQKAAAEQERTRAAAPYAPCVAHAIPLPSSTVGWPPVHTSRRNLIITTHTTKSDGPATFDEIKGVTMLASTNKNPMTSRDTTVIEETRPTANMYAKVYMEGYTIARKINLRAHSSYDSLSQMLTKMTNNFFQPADCSMVNMGEEEFCTTDKFIFLYEDFEGDRMLVGDVPWELFLASAKRLYIVRNPVPGDKGHADCDKND